MRSGTPILVTSLAACAAEEPRPIPQWEAAEAEGDCTGGGASAGVGVSLLEVGDLDVGDGALPAGFGAVILSQEEYVALFRDIEGPEAQPPRVDFAVDQVAAVWLEACRVEVASAGVLGTADASLVLDVTFVDVARNCGYDCEGLSQGLVMFALPNRALASVCRRIEAGCAP